MKNNLLIICPNSALLYQDLKANFSAKEPNIWAGMLANSVRSKGFGVSIYDLEIEEPSEDELIKEVISRSADLILFVVTGQNPNASTAAMQGAVTTAKIIKDSLPNCKISFVGPHVNALPVETLERHDFIDLVFTNEGVYALRNVLSSNLKESELKTIKGIAFQSPDGVVLNPAERTVPQELMAVDLPGVAYDLMPPLTKYRTSSWHSNYDDSARSPFASIYTSLGCIYKCDFCMINIINRTDNDVNKASSDFNKFRFWDPEFTMKGLDSLAEKGITQLKIADEMWVLKPKHFEVLCDSLIERDYKFNIWAYSRIDTVKPKYLEKLKKAGVNWLALGIEAGNQDIRTEITKGKFQDTNIREVVKMVQEAGINVIANYIFGLGHDTMETMQETLDLALELNAESSNMYCATPLPGSPLYRNLRNKGEKLPKEYSEYGFLSYDHIPSPTESLTSKEIVQFRDNAFKTIHTSPKFLSMIGDKFGPKALENITNMNKITLERKILK